ncbi:MAG TPA: GyrI-like domain-containing protein [Pseudolabrys sp.]|nr:GyrI-like domain-containing protein [Pseudolabrys sp.]
MSWYRLVGSLALCTALGLAPALAQTPPPPDKQPLQMPAAPGALQPGDAFGEQVTLPEKTIIYVKGQSTWDNAFATLVESFKLLKQYLDKQGIKPAGPAMTIYTQTDDTGFKFNAALPIATTPKDPPRGDIAIGSAPTGKALKFVHRGPYDAMDSTYEAITNYLDDKRLDAKDLFVEEYVTDPTTTPSDKLVINVYVPVN